MSEQEFDKVLLAQTETELIMEELDIDYWEAKEIRKDRASERTKAALAAMGITMIPNCMYNIDEYGVAHVTPFSAFDRKHKESVQRVRDEIERRKEE